MMINKKLQVWLPLLLSGVMILGMYFGFQLQSNMGGNKATSGKNLETVQQVLDLVNLRYVDSLPLDSMETAAINDIVNQLDPHSVYIPPSKLSEVNSTLQGNFSGIGVEYQVINDTVNFVYILPNGPSGKAGLETGDQLLKVDTVNLGGRSLDNFDLRRLLRGKNGSKVALQLLRQGKVVETTVTRGNVPLPSLEAAYMAAPGIGYIRLSKFAETTYREFMDAATDLKKQGMQKMILDLRGNGGGFMDAATNIADELLADGKLLVSTKGNHIKTKEIRSNKEGIFETGPLVILLDEFSASASEVLAGALQDNDRGTIMGRRSFGKGLVQEQYNLGNGGALRLTVARYYTPTGRSIQKPYINGQNEKYEEEVFDRFSDSIKPKYDSTNVKVFTTKKGKKVYDGGGITPDIVVPFDSTLLHLNIGKMLNSDALNNTVFGIFKKEKNHLNQLGSAEKVVSSYSLPDWVWPQLQQAAKADSIAIKPNDTIFRYQTMQRTKALLARYIWRSNGYFQVNNSTDPMFLKAVSFLKGN